MTPVDDLHMGDWIAVVNDKAESTDDGCIVIKGQYTGAPFVIKSICLPFVCVADLRGAIGSFDVRRYDFQKLSDEYVSAMSQPVSPTYQPPVPNGFTILTTYPAK